MMILGFNTDIAKNDDIDPLSSIIRKALNTLFENEFKAKLNEL